MRFAGFCAAVGVLAVSSTAGAQQEVPFDHSIEVQLFDPAVGPHAFLTVSGAEVDGDKRFAASFLLGYMTHPFTVYNVDLGNGEIMDTRTEVVKSAFSGTLTGSYGIGNKFQLGAALPIVFAMTGDGIMPATAEPAPGGLSVTGFGDARLELAWQFYRRESLMFAAIPAVTVPTSIGSDDSAWLGDNLPPFPPRGARRGAAPG